MEERKRNIIIWVTLSVVSLVSAWVVVSGKMEFMEREFADYTAAKAAGELEKGFLPSFIPQDAAAIKVINNTDQKSSLAAFRFAGSLDLGACKEGALTEATLPAERVVLWWPDGLTSKGGPITGTFYKCADGQAFVDNGKNEVYFWK